MNLALAVDLAIAFAIGYAVIALVVWYGDRKVPRRERPVRLALIIPIVITKERTLVANYELNVGNTAYVPIQTLDAGGKPVPPPTGDTFTVASSDPGLTATVGTMPSGPLSGQPAAVLVAVTVASNITVTLTDADNLTAGTQIVDVIPVADPPTTDFLDISDAVVVPTAPPA